MKKIISIFLVILIILTNTCAVMAKDEIGMSNFKLTKKYRDKQFSDVSATDWYAQNVKMAYEYELMNGTGSKTFSPDSYITLAETIVIACRLHSIYNNQNYDFSTTHPIWYSPYVRYASNNQIIKMAFSVDYNANATRLQFVNILANSLPKAEFLPINKYRYGDIPDVLDDPNVYMMYNAGILSGNDSEGTFNPESTIKRSEVCAIITRMIDASSRIRVDIDENYKIYMDDTIYNFFLYCRR